MTRPPRLTILVPALLAAVAAMAMMAMPAHAQEISLALPEEGALTSRIVQLVLLVAVLSLAPSILIMVTSFVRIAVVLSLLRTAMGVQQARRLGRVAIHLANESVVEIHAKAMNALRAVDAVG